MSSWSQSLRGALLQAVVLRAEIVAVAIAAAVPKLYAILRAAERQWRLSLKGIISLTSRRSNVAANRHRSAQRCRVVDNELKRSSMSALI